MKLPIAIALSSIFACSFILACSGSTSDPSAQGEGDLTGDGAPSRTDAGDAPATTDGASAANACATIADGPFAPELYGRPFSGSEDFAFDGRGHIVGKRGNDVVLANADGSTTLAALPGQTYGLRYHPNGNLIAAIPGAGKLLSVSPAGQVTELLGNLGTPNGVYADFDGNVWITEFGGGKVSRLAADGTHSVVVSGSNAQSANGVVLDPTKKVLFYTEYSKGKINRIAVDTPGATPVNVATIRGAALDGIVLDACGNIYALDQGGSKLYRVRIDANGDASAAPELLASFPTNVANAQFGSGAGFDSKTLYVTGNPGSVYTVAVGVEGAPVPTPAQ